MRSIVALYALLLTSLIVCASLTAYAQEYPRSEFTGAYSFIRTDEDSVDLNQFGVPGTARREAANLNGWNIAVTGNIKSWVGVVGDFGGAYGHITYSATGVGSARAGTSLYTFLGGPQFYIRGNKATFFFRGMVGAAKLDQSATIFGTPVTDNETKFAAGFGGGLDINMNRRVSFRALQVDYILTRFDDAGGLTKSTQGLVRVSSGFTFRN
jgi:hypothetical protein